MTEQFEPASARSQPQTKNPDSLIYGIRWPATRLTYGQLQALRTISKDVRLPITQLLKDAVDVYLIVLKREMQAIMVADPVGQTAHIESDASGNNVIVTDHLAVAESGAMAADENSPTG